MYAIHDSCSFPSINMDNGHPLDKQKRGRFHAIKDRFSLSSSKHPSRSDSPIPPDASSDKDQQQSWGLKKKFLGKHAKAPTWPTSPLLPPSSNNPIAESALSMYPIVS